MNALYLIISVGGIALLVGLNILLFGRRIAALDADAVVATLANETPGFRAGRHIIAEGAHTALVENDADGSLYLVASRGSRIASRKLSRGAVRGLIRDGKSIALRLSDFTFPKASLAFADEQAAQEWEARLKQVVA
jgi:hypothetical protein